MAAIDQSQNAEKRICWGRGDSDAKIFTIRDSSGAVVDISGQAFTLSVDSLLDPPDNATLEFALTGSFVTDGTDGQVQFAPTISETDIAVKEYFYDLQRDTPTKKTLIKAVAEIVQDITKT